MFENIKAKKSFRTEFLINDGIIQKIIAAAELTEDDVVLEVGPGTGISESKALVQTGARGSQLKKTETLLKISRQNLVPLKSRLLKRHS